MSFRYINPYTDFGFKKLFGEEANKDVLIDFLNAVLPEERQIETLTFRNPGNMPDPPTQRLARFDIFCRSKTDEQFVVELQRVPQHYFRDNSVFYSTFQPRNEDSVDDWDLYLKKVIFVAILNFRYDKKKDREKFLHEMTLQNQDGELLYEKLYPYFFQLPIFTKTESELHTLEFKTRKDKWFYFIRNLEYFDNLPVVLQDPIFECAFKAADCRKFIPCELEAYERDLKIYRDNYAVLETARVEGKIKIQKEIAAKMKTMGFSSEDIAKATGMSIDEIEKL
jgi:predicted transposase/invertase (TIGR01784 family)